MIRGLRAFAIATAVGASACGGPTGVATNPPTSGDAGGATAAAASATATAGPQTSGVRTVLSPLGLNIRDAGSPTATRLAAAAQGAQLTVLDFSAANGGWYHVRGATTTGWITSDPTLSAPGNFISYNSAQRGFGALYPASWTFAEEANDVVFRPQTGTASVVVRGAATVSALGPLQPTGYVNSGDTSEVVCGVTGDLLTYDQPTGGTSATPLSATAPLRKHLAAIALKLDASHALALTFNYDDGGDLPDFAAFYNSVTFPFPQCQAPAPAPTP